MLRRHAIAVIGVLSVAVDISLAAIEIGAFNPQIFGKSKGNKPEVIDIYLQVIQHRQLFIYVYILSIVSCGCIGYI